MKNRIIFLSILVYVATISLWATKSNYKFTRLDISQGLSNNQVISILKDHKGFMWFGTMAGLNRFDGCSFKTFKYNPFDTSSLIDNYIIKIFEDCQGKLWIKTRNGYVIYDPLYEAFLMDHPIFHKIDGVTRWTISDMMTDKFGNIWFIDHKLLFKYFLHNDSIVTIPYNSMDTTTLNNAEISSIAEDSKGNIWVIDIYGMIEEIGNNGCKVIYRNYSLFNTLKGKIIYFSINIDKDDDLWFTSSSSDIGLFFLKKSKWELYHFTKESGKARLNNNIITSLVQDDNGLIWIGTDHGGINILNKKDFSVQYITENPDDDKSLSQNCVTTLYKDDNGIIWIGTFKKGIDYYHENIIKFRIVRRILSDPKSLSYDDINCFQEDNKGNLWIGTNGGGLIYFDRRNGLFKNYRHDDKDPNSLSNDVIVSLFMDQQNMLWIGTFYGGLNCFNGTKFIYYKQNPGNPNSISDNKIWRVFEDSHNNFWVGTLGSGLDLFDRKKGIFKHFRAGEINSVNSNYIMSIVEDKVGDIWFGTSYGIDRFMIASQQFIHYVKEPNKNTSLSNNNVTSLLVDSRDLIWAGTREGLCMFDKSKNYFKVFRIEDGLPDNTIISIVEDNFNNLWISTTNGVSNLLVTKNQKDKLYNFSFKNFDESDGLQGRAFNNYAAYRTSNGELFFGGANGFNIFRPEDIKTNNIFPKIEFTDFQVFNKSILANKKAFGRVIIKKSVSESSVITLKYYENIFSIEFVALSYIHPEKNKYSYMLKGFDKNWINTDNKQRRATYTNLDPGEYNFIVKASNNDGLWNETGKSIKIVILPPFWKTPIAFIIYFVLLIAALFYFRHIVLVWERMNYRLEQERQEARQRQEIDLVKIKFFTNISHDLRTPLTLIITPLEKIIRNTQDLNNKKQFLIIYRNAKRLLNLVNQLLDFRRMEVQVINLNPTSGELVKFVNDISWSFTDLSEKKEIALNVNSNVKELHVLFDHDKLEKILFNLLSNAFKFTHEKGSITVELNVKDAPENNLQKDDSFEWIEINVRDTGIGIPKDKQDIIYDRFFHYGTPGNITGQSTGIGLTIVKEFVKLHGGYIKLESEPDKGSSFTIMLPLKKVPLRTDKFDYPTQEDLSVEALLSYDMDVEPIITEKESKKPMILLVDDNEDFLFYLKDNLKEHYRIIEAQNGKEGWRQTLSHIPDLVVSDIMMPLVNGIDLSKKIKSDPRTSHIPVILLTARTSYEKKLEGFESGADDYITKPFNYELLESRIRNLILQRKKLQKIFHKQIEVEPSLITVTSLDEKLIQKALSFVEKNISNPDFSVEELSRDLGMSRVNLYKKLLSITGKTPIEFIRVIRLKRAALLLEKSQQSVSEIAYQVGFNNPKYFSKYFKEEFSMLPSEYIIDKEKTNEKK